MLVRFARVAAAGKEARVDAVLLKVRMARGSGGTIQLAMKRSVPPPRLALPWEE